MLARYGALEVLDAVRIGQAESLNAASVQLQAHAVRPSACSIRGHCLAVSTSNRATSYFPPQLAAYYQIGLLERVSVSNNRASHQALDLTAQGVSFVGYNQRVSVRTLC